MRSILLSKTDLHKYYGIKNVLNYCGLFCEFHKNFSENPKADIIITDNMHKKLANQISDAYGGLVISPQEYEIQFSVDTVRKTNPVEYLKSNVSCIIDGVSECEREYLPALSNMGNEFSFKVFGPPHISALEDYFGQESPDKICASCDLVVITDATPKEVIYEAIINECSVIKTAQDKVFEYAQNPQHLLLLVKSILKNEEYKSVARSIKSQYITSNTYFHEVSNMLKMINHPTVNLIRESLHLKYEENRNYHKQS